MTMVLIGSAAMGVLMLPKIAEIVQISGEISSYGSFSDLNLLSIIEIF